jgi:hypothetical protein
LKICCTIFFFFENILHQITLFLTIFCMHDKSYFLLMETTKPPEKRACAELVKSARN